MQKGCQTRECSLAVLAECNGFIGLEGLEPCAESELVAAFTQLQSAGVQDLVLDIRYNGGGYLDIASEVAYMVAGAGHWAHEDLPEPVSELLTGFLREHA